MMSDGKQVLTPPEELEALLENALAQIIRLERFSGSGVSEDLARAYFWRASALAGLARLDEAFGAYDEVVEKFAHASDPAVLQVVCSALYYKAEVLLAIDDQVGAQRAFAEIWRRFGDTDDLQLQAEVLGARVRSAVVLMADGGLLEGIALLDDVLREASEVRNEAGGVRVAQALGHKAWALYRLGRVGEALVTATELLDKFGESPIPMIREQVAAALAQKADALSGLGEYEEALDATSRLLENFANDSDSAIRSSVANALLTRARILIYFRRDSEAAAELARSKEYLSDANLAQRAEGLEIEGTVRLHEGDPFTALWFYDEAIELSREAEKDGGRYIRALTMSKRADALVKLGRTREARESLSSLVHEFGGDKHPTPQEIVKRAKATLAALA